MKKSRRWIILLFVIILIPIMAYALRDKSKPRGYRGRMRTQEDYITAAEHYMKKKYGDEFEGEYYFEDYVHAHPVEHPQCLYLCRKRKWENIFP